MKKKPSLFERLTGSVHVDHEDDTEDSPHTEELETKNTWLEPSEGELTVDVHQTPQAIIITTMVAGVRPEDLDVTVSRDMVTIRGRRDIQETIQEEDYFHRELYWGSFSRTLLLPCEVEAEEAEAKEEHGLLVLKLPKIDKNKQTKIKVRS